MSEISNATPMDIFQDVDQDWSNRLNAAISIFKEQMQMILEARQEVVQCQHIITQQVNQTARLQVQAQEAGPSTAQGTMSTLLYSKKIEMFDNPGEYNKSKAKFEEWWVKI